MAYQGRKVFAAGEVLTASDLNSTVDQTIMVFDDSTARDTAIPTPVEGMVAYLKSDNSVLKYDGSAWVSVALDINLDADRAVITNAGGDLVVSAVTASELEFLDGVTSNVQTQLDGKQDDVITTEGDLIIGDGSGDASRIAIGAADTVLTSDGTTATWVAGASGGAVNLVNLPFNRLSIFDVDFPVDSLVRFSIITTSSATFEVVFFDASANKVATLNVDRDNPFSYFTNNVAITQIAVSNNIIDQQVILVFTDPTAANDATVAVEVLTITNSQNITLNNSYDAYVFGGGGGGGNASGNGGVASGGGSGRFATGTITPGNYTITIGAGGGGGGTGGSSNIDTLTANGGSAGQQQGSGGAGGSGGGGGANSGGAGKGGFQGNSGGNATFTGGAGSGTAVPQNTVTQIAALSPLVIAEPNASLFGRSSGGIYSGGYGGARNGQSNNPSVAGRSGGGGGGASGFSNVHVASGAAGGAGLIVLVEV